MVFGSDNSPPAGTGVSNGSNLANAPGDMITEGGTATFAQDVLEASMQVPVIVDFWASWCGPCKQLTPILEKVVRSHNGQVRLVKIDADKHQTLTGQMRVQSLPTVYGFKDGRPVDAFTGAQPETQIRAFIDRLIGGEGGTNEVDALLNAASEALAAGDLQGAAETYAAILRDDKENAEALAGLAQCYLTGGDVERAKQTISLVGPDGAQSPGVLRVEAALAVAEKADASGPVAELEKKLSAAPADHQCRFDLAIALAAMGEKQRAVDHLLEIVKKNRAWNEEAARKQLVELFEAWGSTDEATIAGRKQLSSILFA